MIISENQLLIVIIIIIISVVQNHREEAVDFTELLALLSANLREGGEDKVG